MKMKGRIVRNNSKPKKLPVIGKIKVGEKITKNNKEIPVSLDYFVAEGKYKHIFDRKKSKTDALDIMFLSNDPAESCVERMEIRKGSKLFARGDGVTFEVWNGKDYEIKSITDDPDLIQKIEKECENEFDEVLTLYFVIVGINEVFGVWQFSTKGKDSSIPSIVNSFDKVKEIAGTIKFIPFTLSVKKVKSQKPDSKAAFPVVNLVANIGQEYLEKVHKHIESGGDFRELLTEDKIKDTLQIEHTEENAIDTDFVVIPSLEEKLQNCNHIEELDNIASEIRQSNLTENQKDTLKKIWMEKKNEFSKR